MLGSGYTVVAGHPRLDVNRHNLTNSYSSDILVVSCAYGFYEHKMKVESEPKQDCMTTHTTAVASTDLKFYFKTRMQWDHYAHNPIGSKQTWLWPVLSFVFDNVCVMIIEGSGSCIKQVLVTLFELQQMEDPIIAFKSPCCNDVADPCGGL
jgi:hypothetical protein